MENLLRKIVRCLREGRRIVLAHIIRQVGSAPRPLGTSCVILEDGSLIGSVGGGALEFRVMERAKDIFREGKTALLHFNLTGTEVTETDMLCGGIVDVYLEPLLAEDPTAISLFHKATKMIDAGRSGVLLTRVAEGLNADDPTCRVLINGDGSPEDLSGPAWNAALQIQDRLRQAKHPGLEQFSPGEAPIFLQPISPDDILYIFGAGHVSTHIAPLAKSVGFRVVIIDDRAEFANSDRFPSADEIIVIPFSKAFDRVRATRSAYVAIVTRGHSHDRGVLLQTLNKNWAYVGMIGSRRKKEIIYQSLIKAGIAEERLKQVHAPIGLAIGADTPEEIAVSIVAELIQVRANANRTR